MCGILLCQSTRFIPNTYSSLQCLHVIALLCPSFAQKGKAEHTNQFCWNVSTFQILFHCCCNRSGQSPCVSEICDANPQSIFLLLFAAFPYNESPPFGFILLLHYYVSLKMEIRFEALQMKTTESMPWDCY